MKYHIAPEVYTALTAFHRKTLPILLNEFASGVELPQRITIRAGLRGLKVDFYSWLVAVDIVCLLFPPPTAPSRVKTPYFVFHQLVCRGLLKKKKIVTGKLIDLAQKKKAQRQKGGYCKRTHERPTLSWW